MKHEETGAMSLFVYLFRATPADTREAMGTPERARQSLETMRTWFRDLEANGHLKKPARHDGARGARQGRAGH
jgi:hypothetical protein